LVRGNRRGWASDSTSLEGRLRAEDAGIDAGVIDTGVPARAIKFPNSLVSEPIPLLDPGYSRFAVGAGIAWGREKVAVRL